MHDPPPTSPAWPPARSLSDRRARHRVDLVCRADRVAFLRTGSLTAGRRPRYWPPGPSILQARLFSIYRTSSRWIQDEGGGPLVAGGITAGLRPGRYSALRPPDRAPAPARLSALPSIEQPRV